MSRAVVERALAIIELGTSAFLGVESAMAFFGAFFAERSEPMNEAAGWSELLLLVVLPMFLCFAAAGVTMFRHTQRRWWYQLLPLLAMSGAAIFLLVP